MGYLLEFDGIGPKTVSCALLFAAHRPVFPVDTHIHRIAKRLKLVREKAEFSPGGKQLAFRPLLSHLKYSSPEGTAGEQPE
ncbi:MAG: endonuclease III domain-containing protein [Bacillota bacterium]